MDIVQTQNALKALSDQQLQSELLQPSGQVPSFLVLSELQRRKDLRATQGAAAPPQQSMAQEFMSQPQGMAAAQGRYAQAVTGAANTPPAQAMQANPGAQMPPQMTKGYAGGGEVDDDSVFYPSLSRNPWQSSVPYPTLPQILQNVTPAVPVGPNGQLPSHWDQAVPPGATVEDSPQGTLFNAQPGLSVGETIARRLQGRPVSVMPSGATSPGDEGVSAGMGIAALNPQSIPLPDQESQSGVQPGAFNATPTSQPYGGGDIYPSAPVGAGAGLASAGAAGPRVLPSPTAPGANAAGGGAGLRAPGAGGGTGVGGSPLAQRANQSLADYYSEIQGIMPHDRFDELAKANQEDKDQLAAQHQNDKGMALLQAGLGIMAGQSPFAAVNIGQGAQKGIQYWQQAQNEMRQAQRDIRNSDAQIAIAQANRDERSVDNAVRMKAQSEENYQRSLDRANAAGIAAANRAASLDLKKMEIEDNAKTRQEALDNSRINNFENLSRSYYQQAQNSRTQLLGLQSKINMGALDPNNEAVKAQIAEIQDKIKRFDDMGDMHQTNARNASLDRERRLGNIKTYGSQAEVNAAKLPKGTIYYDGQNYRQVQ